VHNSVEKKPVEKLNETSITIAWGNCNLIHLSDTCTFIHSVDQEVNNSNILIFVHRSIYLIEYFFSIIYQILHRNVRKKQYFLNINFNRLLRLL
jgi:hypothetical protein